MRLQDPNERAQCGRLVHRAVKLRGRRFNKRTPSRVSSRRLVRLSPDGDRPRRLAAALDRIAR
jgi:hypothetical protein